jgi:hypothetical protein
MRTLIGWGTVVMLGLAGTACALPAPRVSLDPAANFTAHVEARGIVVDRMADGEHARVVAKGAFFRPRLVVEEGRKDVAMLSPEGSDTIVSVATSGGDDPTIGDVKAEWTHGAIDLTFAPNGHAAYRTTPFRRVNPWRTPQLLGQPADNVVELPGRYVADVESADGRRVGWLSIEIADGGPVSRLYEGDLPPSINGPLAVAAVERLNEEVDWVEQHAINPYVGN